MHPKRRKYVQKFIKLVAYVRNRRFREIAVVVVRSIPYLPRLFGRPDKRELRQQQKILDEALNRLYGFNTRHKRNALKVELVLHDAKFLPKSSAFIRLIGPLSQPNIRKHISLKLADGKKPIPRHETDVCIVQRTAISNLSSAKKFIKHLKNNRIKLVVDLDDAFVHIDKTHPEHKQTQLVLMALQALIEASHELWVSTDALGDYYKSVTDPKKVVVIKNSLDPRVWAEHKPVENKSTILELIYMGTATHGADFELIVPVLDRLYEKYPSSFQLSMVGITSKPLNKPWLNILPRSNKDVMYPYFVKWLQRQQPFDIGIAPLVDNEFNRSKSDVKILDYLGIGALPLASDVSPYNSQEIDNYIIRCGSSEEWYKVLESATTSLGAFRDNKESTIEKAKQYVWSQRSADKTSVVLLARLNKLSDKSS